MEIWKDVTGYEGVYQVSNKGRLKSCEKIWIFGGTLLSKPEKIINGGLDHYGYMSVMFSKNNIQKRFKIHRIVANEFIKNTENKPIVNHINGIKTDNRVENLEWVTNKENSNHARAIGLVNDYGENSVNSKLNSNKVIKIISFYKSGRYSQQKLAEMFSVHIMTINSILLGKSWKHITNGERIEIDKRKRKTLVLDTQTGVFYESISQAAVAKNIPAMTLTSYISGRIKNKTSIIAV